jgi:hypothetical protein
MSTPTAEEKKAVQAKVNSIAETLKSDPAARESAQKDPMAFLTAHGLPTEASKELLTAVAKASGSADVSGYDYYVDTDVYLDGAYFDTIRDWYSDWGVFLFEEIVVK